MQADQAHLKSTRSVTHSDVGTVHELRLASGTVVREYEAPNGTVFAVTWEGPWIPDLRSLLGAYFAPYAEAARTSRRAHGALQVRSPGLVVEISGHMRAFAGRAYVPEMLPAGVGAEAIR